MPPGKGHPEPLLGACLDGCSTPGCAAPTALLPMLPPTQQRCWHTSMVHHRLPQQSSNGGRSTTTRLWLLKAFPPLPIVPLSLVLMPPPQALSTVRAARQVLQTAGASGYTAAFLLAASQALALRGALVGPGRASLPVLLGMAALAAGVLEQQLGRLEQQFVFVDYAHADK